ncbi:MAG: protein kinase family protein [Phycisphaeraceae bacterium]|nr:protein kinase family protein [Phycisphaeraceae bacterium]
MTHAGSREFFGPYQLVRPLEPSSVAERWLALHVRWQSSHVVHRLDACRDRGERRRMVSAFETVAALNHPHILRVEQFSFGARGCGWLVTPYTGSPAGLLTLAGLVELKGGRLGEFESQRMLEQLLDASACAHEAGHANGRLDPGGVLVDRSGSVLIEHYGLAPLLLRDPPRFDDLAGDELRSIASIGYRALTGLTASEPLIRPSRVLKRLERGWDEWFETALDSSGGFGSIRDAIEALPTNPRGQLRARAAERGSVRVVLRRLRRAPGSPPSE